MLKKLNNLAVLDEITEPNKINNENNKQYVKDFKNISRKDPTKLHINKDKSSIVVGYLKENKKRPSANVNQTEGELKQNEGRVENIDTYLDKQNAYKLDTSSSLNDEKNFTSSFLSTRNTKISNDNIDSKVNGKKIPNTPQKVELKVITTTFLPDLHI